MTNQFNMDEAIKALRACKYFTGKDGVLTPLIKQLKIAEIAKPLKISKRAVPLLS
jgi:hypothetical protein